MLLWCFQLINLSLVIHFRKQDLICLDCWHKNSAYFIDKEEQSASRSRSNNYSRAVNAPCSWALGSRRNAKNSLTLELKTSEGTNDSVISFYLGGEL
jgi:hypothetical protein